eukprot:SAG31_NODE_971_length_10655_cov_35.774915_2_plen_80_part_00
MSQQYTARLNTAFGVARRRLHGGYPPASHDEVDAAKDLMVDVAAAMTGALDSRALFLEGGEPTHRMGSTCALRCDGTFF